MAGSTSTKHHVIEAQSVQEAVWRDLNLSVHAVETMQSKLTQALLTTAAAVVLKQQEADVKERNNWISFCF